MSVNSDSALSGSDSESDVSDTQSPIVFLGLGPYGCMFGRGVFLKEHHSTKVGGRGPANMAVKLPEQRAWFEGHLDQLTGIDDCRRLSPTLKYYISPDINK